MPTTPRLLMSPERFRELRIDIAERRRALATNSTIFGMRHAPTLAELARPVLRPDARVSLDVVLQAMADGDRWTDSTVRRLRPILGALRRSAGREANDADRQDTLAWHLDRMDEILRQYEILRHRSAMLDMANTDRRPLQRDSERARRVRAALLAWDRRPPAPAA